MLVGCLWVLQFRGTGLGGCREFECRLQQWQLAEVSQQAARAHPLAALTILPLPPACPHRPLSTH